MNTILLACELLVKWMEAIRVFIIEYNSFLLEHQSRLLCDCQELSVCGTASSYQSAMDALVKTKEPPHIILLDQSIPDADVIEATKQIKATMPRTEIIISTAFEDENKLLRAIEAGASGYLMKGASFHKIRDGIIDVYRGGAVITPVLTRKLLKYFEKPHADFFVEHQESKHQSKHIASLTVRERECLQIIAKGLSTQETASVLNLSAATIRTHLEHIYQKLDVSNRVEAITEGIRQGIINL